MDQYRVTREVPLPYPVGNPQSNEDDDDDDDCENAGQAASWYYPRVIWERTLDSDAKDASHHGVVMCYAIGLLIIWQMWGDSLSYVQTCHILYAYRESSISANCVQTISNASGRR
jgi:hypothetical protein